MVNVGIDEVGRGCWAGPLVASAVVLGKPIVGLKDSKKLTKKQRQRLAAEIQMEALAIGIGWVWPKEIDVSGITTAVKTAMSRALKQIRIDYDEIIIDGNYNFLADVKGLSSHKVWNMIKADDSVAAVSAASIIAKVARDNYMVTEAHAVYPTYGFDTHVGYGTALHIERLKLHGVTKLHRMSYKPIQQLLVQSSA